MTFDLYVDDVRQSPSRWVLAKTFDDAIRSLKTGNVNHLSLDHDLGLGKTGMDIVKFMMNNKIYPNKITIHSKNPVGKQNMLVYLLRYGPYRRETQAFILVKDISLFQDIYKERR